MNALIVRYYPSWIISPAIIRSKLNQKINIKWFFIFPLGKAYQELPFLIKNFGATFQRSMSYGFHNIKKILEEYMADLATHSDWWDYHPVDMSAIFMCCCYYNIYVIPHKCIFCVVSRHFIFFNVSNYRFMIDPCKFEVIINLPPPHTISQIQNFQHKVNFLCWFISNYAEITKGFMHLLKKDTPFVWDDQAQWSFYALKKALMLASLLSPFDYKWDFILYLTTYDSTLVELFSSKRTRKIMRTSSNTLEKD